MTDHSHLSAHSIALALESSPGDEFLASLEACPTCSQALQEYRFWQAVIDHDGPLVALEYPSRHVQFAKLCRHSAQARRALVEAESLFHRWGLSMLLLEESERADDDPDHALHLTHLVLEIAPRLDPEIYGLRQIQDLVARTYLRLMVVQIARGEARPAAQALAQARHHLAQGTGRPDLAEEFRSLEVEGVQPRRPQHLRRPPFDTSARGEAPAS